MPADTRGPEAMGPSQAIIAGAARLQRMRSDKHFRLELPLP